MKFCNGREIWLKHKYRIGQVEIYSHGEGEDQWTENYTKEDSAQINLRGFFLKTGQDVQTSPGEWYVPRNLN